MKSTLHSLFLALLLISCSKKDNIESNITIDPTNELVGTVWQRTLNPDLYNYLQFKTSKEVEFSSKYNGELSTALALPCTLNEKNLVYTHGRINYTGTISRDTLPIMGTAGLMIYVKVK